MIIHVLLPQKGVYIFFYEILFPSSLSQCLRLLTENVNLEGMYVNNYDVPSSFRKFDLQCTTFLHALCLR